MSRLRSAASMRSNATGASFRSGRTNRVQGGSVKPTKTSATLEYPCNPCMRENNNIEAINFCLDCEENLCMNCVKDHAKFQTMQTHTILGKADRRSINDVDAPPKVNPLECSHHPGKLVDMYCADHDQIWCGACMALNHKECQNIMVLQTAAKGIAKKSLFKEIKDDSRKMKKDLTMSKKHRMKHLIRFDKHKSLVVKKIKDHRKSIDKILDNLEKETLSELELACERGMSQMKEEVKLYDNIISGLEAATGMLTVIKGEEKNETTIFVGLKRAKQNIQDGERILRYANHAFSVAPIKYYPDENILKWLKSVTYLGAFSHHQTIYSGQFADRYDVSMADDLKSCDMFGSALVPDGRLILTDWDNKKVKLLDSSFRVVDHVTVPGNPNGICLTNPEEAIVTLPMQNTIQFINMASSMALTRMILTEDHCRGLCYHDGNIYVVCGGFKGEIPGRIVVYTVMGDLVRIIEKNRTGQQIFMCPIAVSVRSDGKLMHVTDGRRGIITLTLENDVVSVVAHKNIAWPCGICMDNNGHVLVCNCRTDSVILMTGFNKFATVLSHDDGLRRPHSICFDPETSRVVMTMNRSKFVYVYELQDVSVTQAVEGAKLNLETAKPGNPDGNKTDDSKAEDMTSGTTNDIQHITTNADDAKEELASESKAGQLSVTKEETGPTTTTLMSTSTELKKIPEETRSEQKPAIKRRPSSTLVPSDKRSVLSRTTRTEGSRTGVPSGSTDQLRIKTSSRDSNVSETTSSMKTNSARGDRKLSSRSVRMSSLQSDRSALKHN